MRQKPKKKYLKRLPLLRNFPDVFSHTSLISAMIEAGELQLGEPSLGRDGSAELLVDFECFFFCFFLGSFGGFWAIFGLKVFLGRVFLSFWKANLSLGEALLKSFLCSANKSSTTMRRQDVFTGRPLKQHVLKTLERHQKP